MEIKVLEEIKKVCLQFVGIVICVMVENIVYSEFLWKKIDEFIICYCEMYIMDFIKDMVMIYVIWEVYKKCGKDFSCYCFLGEVFCCRILCGIFLYQIDILVDFINLVFICYGYFIGGFDVDKI